MNKLVSAIIPTYNREKTICRAVDSIISQTYKNIEIVVVDDGSVDDTLKLLEVYGGNVRVIRQCHKGANAARNRGIREAKGEYIAFLDSDDEWLPQKTYIQMDYLEKKGGQVCYCAYKLISDKTQIVPDIYTDEERYGSNLNVILSQHNVIGTPTLMIKKSVLEDVGLFDESMQRLQDYELCIRIAKKYKIGYIPQVLVNAYYMEKSISNSNDLLVPAYCRIIKMHGDFIDQDELMLRIIRECETNNSFGIDGSMIDCISEKSGLSRSYIIDKVLAMYREADIRKSNYIKKINEHEYDLFIKRNAGKKFAVFGTGRIAEKVYQKLRCENKSPDTFYVSRKSKDQDFFHNIIVETINGKDIHKPVIIAVGYRLQIEVMDILDSMGCDNYCVYPVSRLG